MRTINKILAFGYTGVKMLTVLFLFMLAGALLSGEFDGRLIPIS